MLPRIKYDMYVHKTGITDANGGERKDLSRLTRPGGSRSCVTALHNATLGGYAATNRVPMYFPPSLSLPVNARLRNLQSYT